MGLKVLVRQCNKLLKPANFSNKCENSTGIIFNKTQKTT